MRLWVFGILFAFVSQAIAKNHIDTSCIKPFMNVSDSSVGYSININMAGKALSGLFYIKSLDHNRYHAVCISEMGLTLFEIQISADSAKVLNCIDPLKKDKILKLLTRQLTLLVHPLGSSIPSKKYTKKKILYFKFAPRQYFCSVDSSCRIMRAKAGRGFSKVKLRYTYSNSQSPQHISLKQNWIRTTWKLEQLEKI